MNRHRYHPTLRTPWCWLPVLAALSALPCQAQYKLIGADGKVTYTDRQPSPSAGKVTALRATGGVAAADSSLPLELRQPVARYPVTLYTSNGNCEPCESARQLLRQRGVPFAEKQVQSAEDSEALERLSGGRDVPSLTIGAQTLRGFAPEVWRAYLDAAAYPRESRLPSTYQYASPVPLTERREASARITAPRTSQPGDADGSSSAARPVPPPTGIRF